MYDRHWLVLAHGHAIAALAQFRDSGAAADYGTYDLHLQEFVDLLDSLYENEP